jgi:hypothetical protein
MINFFVDIVGLTPKGGEHGVACLGGSAGGEDLQVVEVPEGAKTGLQAFAFIVPGDFDMSAAAGSLRENGIDTELSEGPEGPLLTVIDPDGFRVEFVNLPS